MNANRAAIYNPADVQLMFQLADREIAAYLACGNFFWQVDQPIKSSNQLDNIDLLRIAALIFWGQTMLHSSHLLLITDRLSALRENFYGDRSEFLKPCLLVDSRLCALSLQNGLAAFDAAPYAPIGYYQSYWIGSMEPLFPIVRDAAYNYWGGGSIGYQEFLYNFDGLPIVNSGKDAF